MDARLTRRTVLALAGAVPLSGFQQAPGPIELTAGGLTMVFEPELGFLRYIRYGETEVIRGIYAAVRDRNWGTVAPRLGNIRLETANRGFRLTFDVVCQEGAIDFAWKGTITGEAAGTVRFAMEGEARSTFLRNRLGFAVLHPIEGCAGKWCTVRHSDGSKEQGKFPLQVAPHQPFKDITAIAHEVAPGVTAEVAFRGEVFEMEDHRNWTDASFKTYCTPLEKPFPVEVAQGTRVEQAVTVSLQGAGKAASRAAGRRAVTVQLAAGEARPLPRLGLGFSGWSPRLAALRPAHVRIDASDLAKAPAGVPLEVALHLEGGGEGQLKQAAEAARKLRVARWLVYHKSEKSTSAKWVRLSKKHLTGAPVGGGSNAYFAELNRERPETADLDFLCYSINPQVHAFDDASMAENLAAQADAVESARQFAGGKGIVITPVTLLPRFNPNATEALGGGPPADPRQSSLFCAAWTLGSIKYLAESGAAAVTYFETLGARGVAAENAVYPVYHVLADVLAQGAAEALRSRSSQPLAVDALVLRQGAKHAVLLANMTDHVQAVRCPWPGNRTMVALRRLDGYSLAEATASPEAWRARPPETFQPKSGMLDMALEPHAVVTIWG